MSDPDLVLLRLEQVRVAGLSELERCCAELRAAGRLDQALDLACRALAGEPLRESAHRELILVHLAAGRQDLAERQYDECARLLRDQLGVRPSGRLRALLDRRMSGDRLSDDHLSDGCLSDGRRSDGGSVEGGVVDGADPRSH